MNKNKIVFTFILLVIMCFYGCAGGKKKTADAITFDIATMRNVARITDSGLDKSKLAVSPDGSKILYGEAKTKKIIKKKIFGWIILPEIII